MVDLICNRNKLRPNKKNSLFLITRPSKKITAESNKFFSISKHIYRKNRLISRSVIKVAPTQFKYFFLKIPEKGRTPFIGRAYQSVNCDNFVQFADFCRREPEVVGRETTQPTGCFKKKEQLYITLGLSIGHISVKLQVYNEEIAIILSNTLI